MNIFGHLRTIKRHKRKVMKYCFKCGLYKQGLLHDLSKYSPVEFLNGAKYYSGTFSPNNNERKDKGRSDAWMHHKGRNKHHPEYWIDIDTNTHQYVSIDMPRRYIAESMCDKIAASKNYNKNNFEPEMVRSYFNYEKDCMPMSENTKRVFTQLIDMYVEKGEDYLFKYLKENFRNDRTDY